MLVAIGAVIAQSATRFSALALDAPSQRVWSRREETPLAPGDASEVIARLVQRAQAAADMDAADVRVGCALDADLDAERETVISLRYASGWDGARFGTLLAQRLPVPIALATYTEAAAVAEFERGAARGQRSALYILPARGITACFIERGQIITGARGAAGSLDHWPAQEDGPRCACGERGHLSVLASAQSIVRAMIGRASASDESTAAVLRASGGRAEAMSAAQVVALAVEGDRAALSVIQDATAALATALAALTLMLDPGVIVVGGPLALANSYYFRLLNDRLRAHTVGTISPATVIPGLLEPDAALTGAGILAARR
jgi:glucokinase